MRDLFVINGDTEKILKDSTILVDTNVLFDAWKFKTEFADLLTKLTDLDCYLVTTPAVVIEFLGGTKGQDDLKAKVEFIEAVFGKTLSNIFLPLAQQFPDAGSFLAFSRQANNFSTTDFELYCALKKYAHSGLMLMTRNHRDFTPPMFNRQGFITLVGTKEIHTHCLYGL
jgi:hypothetical protein